MNFPGFPFSQWHMVINFRKSNQTLEWCSITVSSTKLHSFRDLEQKKKRVAYNKIKRLSVQHQPHASIVNGNPNLFVKFQCQQQNPLTISFLQSFKYKWSYNLYHKSVQFKTKRWVHSPSKKKKSTPVKTQYLKNSSDKRQYHLIEFFFFCAIKWYDPSKAKKKLEP